MLEIKKAVRRQVPLLLGCFGPTGSGKTLSALLIAVGLSPNGKIGLIDTEPPRGSLHADNERLMKVLPNGFQVIEVDPPHTPERISEAVNKFEEAGCEVCIVDSLSDAWSGVGGCEDMKEKTKGWAKPKRENKRMMMRFRSSKMHIICCLKAHEKTRIIEGPVNQKTGKAKQEYINLGMQPETEKNNTYPMLLVFSLDEKTHEATATKITVEALKPSFSESHLLSVGDGERIREWNETGAAMPSGEQLGKRARAAADEGLESYKKYFAGLSNSERKALGGVHEENKKIAAQADEDRAQQEQFEKEESEGEPL